MERAPNAVPSHESHTGRELEFMLTRGKPLAHFCDYYPPEPDEAVIPQATFRPHVKSELVEERRYVELQQLPVRVPQPRGVLHVLYARRGEGWRIDAYIAMQYEADQAGWSERFERLQGSLLGYTDHENDLHINRLLETPAAQVFPWLKRLADSQRHG